MNKGYGFTPNNMIPLNNREPGEVADIALSQLRPYEIAAETWPVGRVFRDKRNCMCCRVCDQNLWFVTDLQGQIYNYTEAEQKTLIIAHIRQCHAAMIDDKGDFEYASPGEYQVLDGPGNAYSHSFGGSNANRPEHKGSDPTGIE